MQAPDADIRLLLELHADGELDPSDRERVERRLAEDPAAREYLAALVEMRDAVRMPIEHAAEQVEFGGLFDRVMARVDAEAATPASTLARSAELDALAVAFADGQVVNAEERARAMAYIDAHAEVREGFEAVRDLGELVRAPIEHAAEQVDFEALAARIATAIDHAAARSSTAAPVAVPTPTFWGRLAAIFRENRAVFASAATAAEVVLLMLPFTGGEGGDPVEIHNHYYEFPVAEAVNSEQGYTGAYFAGSKVGGVETAPVIWIAPEGSAMDFEKEPDTDPDAGLTDQSL